MSGMRAANFRFRARPICKEKTVTQYIYLSPVLLFLVMDQVYRKLTNLLSLPWEKVQYSHKHFRALMNSKQVGGNRQEDMIYQLCNLVRTKFL